MTEQVAEVTKQMTDLNMEMGELVVSLEDKSEEEVIICPLPEMCGQVAVDEWHKLCGNCKFPLIEHPDYGDSHVETIRKQLQISRPELLLDQYCWSPPELNEQEIQQYMGMLNADDRPTTDRSADVKRQLLTQLPSGDLVKSANFSLNNKETNRLYDQFKKERDLECLGLGDVGPAEVDSVCAGCNKPAEKGSLVVFSDVSDDVWHPDCFRCFECKQLLAELVHCFDGDLLCARHYGDSIKKRCYSCDQLIFASEYTNSKGHYFHMEHYNCSQCKEPLTGKRYVLRQEQPTCLPCYEEKFANRCEKCEKPIGTDFKDLSYKGRHWHEACFLCWGCENSLANQQFVAKDTGLYCPDCYDKSFAQRCDACTNTFKHGMQKFEYNGKKYHHDCFCCGECKQPIGNNSFVPKDEDKLICMPCYNDNFAQKCAKCSEVLLQGGVTFREAAYHRECFLCTSCKTELANVKFATKDDQPYCPDCYIKTFAKICEKCTKPIAGLGQATKYVAFEGRQWHADCFMCAKCEKSLLGQGFLVCNQEVVCPDCGKNM